MAFGNFSVSTAYATIISMLNAQLTAVGKLFKDQTTGDFTDQVRWSSANKRLESWNGSAWVAIDMTGTAAGSATNADQLDGNHATAFATATQGTKADNALPASSYTAFDIVSKINSGFGGSISSADNAGSAQNANGTGSIPKTGSENGLRIIRGVFSTNGANNPNILVGSGWTIVRNSVANFTITFSPAFTALPAIVFGPYYASSASYWTQTAHSASSVTFIRVGAIETTGEEVSFIAIGPN